METKLSELRNKQIERVKSEQERLDAELNDLKRAHMDKKQELLITHESEIEDLRKTHEEYLGSAKKNFEKKMAKLKI